MRVPAVHMSVKLLSFSLFLLFSCASCTTFLCTRSKGCVAETGFRAYCHQPTVSSFSVTVILQTPTLSNQVYGFFDITQRFYVYLNGTFEVEPQPLRNVWCYIGFDVRGNELDFEVANISSVQDDDADFGPLKPFVDNANASSIFIPVDESVIPQLATGDEEQEDKGNPFGLCCGSCKRRR